ncbi:hypothetical protein SADUNF_Sadunf03G0149000 [Salix dunnii]|uniref:Uncharacterized protein n=1 Tax=Salix dunnii TaxID=1413687 RepID=A0A835N4Y8_9ROSI|nr:hypothetical protein SADUNF_Sadunf03G0149000 [Salix dunnii]
MAASLGIGRRSPSTYPAFGGSNEGKDRERARGSPLTTNVPVAWRNQHDRHGMIGVSLDDCTFTSAYVTILESTPISRCSRHQEVVARSSTEAEFWALATAASETIWILHLLHELGFPLSSPPKLLCDNLGALISATIQLNIFT